MDFVDGLAELPVGDVVGRLLEVIERVAVSDGFIGYSSGVEAVAAAALLTAVGLEEPLATWREGLSVDWGPRLARTLLAALERVQGVESELATLWGQAGRSADFAASLSPTVTALRRLMTDPLQPSLSF